MQKLFERMWRAAKLDVSLYEEVEKDPTLLKDSMIVVILSSLAAGLGGLAQGGGIGRLILISLMALVAWYIWAFLTYLIGTKLLPEQQTKADVGELLRTIGFSSSPGVIRIFGIFPGIGHLIIFAANVWMLVAMIIAIRQALDYKSTGRAIAVCLISWVIQIVVFLILISLMVGIESQPL